MVSDSRLVLSERLTPRQNELQAARSTHDATTDTTTTSALGHRQPIQGENIAPHAASTAANPAGSIWSNKNVVIPSSPPDRNVITPGLRQLKPTPPHPSETDPYHSIFRDSAHNEFADVNSWEPRDNLPEFDKDLHDLAYRPKAEWLEDADKYQEIFTSYMENVPTYDEIPRSNFSLDKVDQLMHGDGADMVLFGRWRHHRDAPLSFVRRMIEEELRGAGANSLYGPGGLDISDHPLVCYYNDRVRKLQQAAEENDTVVDAEPLSPIMMQGSSAAQRLSLRMKTPITFGMSKEGAFLATGFHKRTGSMGSTVESSSSYEGSLMSTSEELADMSTYESSDIDADDVQEDDLSDDPRHDSSIYGSGYSASSYSLGNIVRTGHSSLGNYEILRHYSPDPKLDYDGANNGTAEPYGRRQRATVSADYIRDHCGGADHFGRVYFSASAPVSGQHARDTTRAGTSCQRGYPMQRSGKSGWGRSGRGVRYAQRAQPGHPEQHTHDDGQEYEEIFERLEYLQQLNHSERLEQQQKAQPIPQAHTKRLQCSGHQSASAATKQSKHVSFDMSKNQSFRIPARSDHRVTLVAPDNAENAMWSDDDDNIIGSKEAPNIRKTSPAQSMSLLSQAFMQQKALDRASERTSLSTNNALRPILRSSSSSALESDSSSLDSAAAGETAGLNASTELTPSHATPGTPASSGGVREIMSPARVGSLARRIFQRLKHETVFREEDEEDSLDDSADDFKDDFEDESFSASID
jgi:hypothetical protein